MAQGNNKWFSRFYITMEFVEFLCFFSAALLSYLRLHPDLKGHKGIEVHFFDNKFEKGLDYYKSLMLKSYPHQLTFEKVG